MGGFLNPRTSTLARSSRRHTRPASSAEAERDAERAIIIRVSGFESLLRYPPLKALEAVDTAVTAG
jgi:hypothetical protein